MNYWKHQSLYDILIALLFAIILSSATYWGLPTLVEVQSEEIALASRMWVAPALTLLGMMSATIAFIFSVVEKDQFRFLRAYKAENQLWIAFAENIIWLGISAVFAAILSFFQHDEINILLRGIALFFLIIVSICILKFCWLMYQIVSVRVSQNEHIT